MHQAKQVPRDTHRVCVTYFWCALSHREDFSLSIIAGLPRKHLLYNSRSSIYLHQMKETLDDMKSLKSGPREQEKYALTIKVARHAATLHIKPN